MTAYPGSATDSVGRGPKRWDRAARNAELRPDSKGAGLYFARLEAAEKIADLVPYSGHRPRRHVRREWGFHRQAAELTTRYWTCGVKHAAMQMSLDIGSTDYMAIADHMFGIEAEIPDDPGFTATVYLAQEPSRNVRCQVCGVTITPNLTLEGEPTYDVEVERPARVLPKLLELAQSTAPWAQSEPKRTLYYEYQGTLVNVADLRVVELTDDQFLVAGFLDADGVIDMVRVLGRTGEVR